MVEIDGYKDQNYQNLGCTFHRPQIHSLNPRIKKHKNKKLFPAGRGENRHNQPNFSPNPDTNAAI